MNERNEGSVWIWMARKDAMVVVVHEVVPIIKLRVEDTQRDNTNEGMEVGMNRGRRSD